LNSGDYDELHFLVRPEIVGGRSASLGNPGKVGGNVRSGHAGMPASPVPASPVPASAVLAAGLGLRHGRGWALRSASFRIEAPADGGRPAGIATADSAVATAVVSLLAGQARPGYGELRVLGHDLTTSRGLAAVRGQVGVARLGARPRPACRVRGLVERAARSARLPRHDRRPLTAAILDRLGLTGWAEVPLRSAPDLVARRARLAAAAVHEPSLLLLDGPLDGLPWREAAAVAETIRHLARDTTVIATGADPDTLALACDDILTLGNGILLGQPEPAGLLSGADGHQPGQPAAQGGPLP
jgi:ABC-type branched-subunit amino acid transport system ATPase component